jgi:nitroreductase
MILDLILKNRSYRRFNQLVKIEPEQVKRWIELARFSGSGRNMQPLKYVIVTDEIKCSEIFPNLGWAGYLTSWNGPAEGERPVAYIAVLHDKQLSDKYFCDDGIAMQSILLGATEEGFGGCILGSVNKVKVSKILNLPDHLEMLWMIALGKPAETIVLETVKEGDIKYWRDDESVHHVPKRELSELIIKVL